MNKVELIQKLLDEKKITAEEAVMLLQNSLSEQEIKEKFDKNSGKQLLLG